MTALRADCGQCFALCCVAPAFAKSADFAVDKPAGKPCRNLLADFRCGIHPDLRSKGFPGCTVFDCFGAGQQVAQVTFAGKHWRDAPETAPLMFDVFATMRHLHELLYYLDEARTLAPADDVSAAFDRIAELTMAAPEKLAGLDVGPWRTEVNTLLTRVSEQARAGLAAKNHRGADLVGAKLRGANLRGANLRGAYLIGADLRKADLRQADVIGADFRGADVRGADLTGALFLIQSQLDAAIGDATTKLPQARTNPAHW